MLAVAGHVFDDEPAPAELKIALRIERYGDPWDRGWRQWPAGLLARSNVALRVFYACRGYKSAKKTTDWVKANPDAWELVTSLMKRRRDAVRREQRMKQRRNPWR